VKGFEGRNTNKRPAKKKKKTSQHGLGKTDSRWGDDEHGCWKILSSFGCKTAAGDFPQTGARKESRCTFSLPLSIISSRLSRASSKVGNLILLRW
jgi:hypothetical protein